MFLLVVSSLPMFSTKISIIEMIKFCAAAAVAAGFFFLSCGLSAVPCFLVFLVLYSFLFIFFNSTL